MSLNDTLETRAGSHGLFSENTVVTQSVLRMLQRGRCWDELNDPQLEALHMIAHKMARIVCGDPNFADHWHDISGYSKLIEDMLKD